MPSNHQMTNFLIDLGSFQESNGLCSINFHHIPSSPHSHTGRKYSLRVSSCSSLSSGALWVLFTMCPLKTQVVPYHQTRVTALLSDIHSTFLSYGEHICNSWTCVPVIVLCNWSTYTHREQRPNRNPRGPRDLVFVEKIFFPWEVKKRKFSFLPMLGSHHFVIRQYDLHL